MLKRGLKCDQKLKCELKCELKCGLGATAEKRRVRPSLLPALLLPPPIIRCGQLTFAPNNRGNLSRRSLVNRGWEENGGNPDASLHPPQRAGMCPSYGHYLGFVHQSAQKHSQNGDFCVFFKKGLRNKTQNLGKHIRESFNEARMINDKNPKRGWEPQSTSPDICYGANIQTKSRDTNLGERSGRAGGKKMRKCCVSPFQPWAGGWH